MNRKTRRAAMSHREKLWRSRLQAWEDELRTDRCGFAHLAPRCIALLKSEIEEFWPGVRAGDSVQPPTPSLEEK